mgnify:CR=1 FL=1
MLLKISQRYAIYQIDYIELVNGSGQLANGETLRLGAKL